MQHFDAEPIDLYHHDRKLAHELASLEHDTRLLPEHRSSIARFVSDARAGRLTGGRSKKRLSIARCRKMLGALRRVALELAVPFDRVEVPEMERIIFGLESGTIQKLVRNGGTTRYTHESVLDFKKILRRFYRWIFATDETRCRALTGWFDTSEKRPQLRTFAISAVERMGMAANQLQARALIWLLFDGGFRIGELLNVRLYDVSFRPDADGAETCFVCIRVSKTMPRTISLPLATPIVRFWIERHPSGGRVRSDGLIEARDPNGLLITYTYDYCKKVLADIGRQELNERVYPHRFRHASATFYAKHLTEYQLKARFGWAMGSSVPQRYVDHSGVLAEDTASVIRRSQAVGPAVGSPNFPTEPMPEARLSQRR